MASDVRRPVHACRGLFALAITVAVLVGLASAQPVVVLSPKDGPPTTTLRVSGSGFTPYSQIDIYFDSQDQALVVADAAGAFSQIAIQAPKSAVPGNHWVTAAERSGHLVKQEIFEVHVNWTEFLTQDMRRENPYENVLSVDNVGSLEKRGMGKTGSYIFSGPAVVDGVVYVATEDGKVYAFNLSPRGLLWVYNTGRGRIWGSPAVVNGVLYIGSEDGNLYALDAKTGTKLWSSPVGRVIVASPVVVEGVVYVGSHAVDASTGTELWSYPAKSDSTPAVAHGVVYIYSDDDGNFYALDARTGTKLWSFAIGQQASDSIVANGVVYVGAGSGNVYALDARTGAVLWSSSPTGDNFHRGSPAMANGVLYIGSGYTGVYALDAQTGTVLWKYAIDSEMQSSPAVANGVVYIGGGFWTGGDFDSFKLYALNASTGALLWSYQTDSNVSSSPAVANGVVYVGSEDRHIYAFGLPKKLAPQAPKRPDPKALRPDFNLKPVSTTE